MARQIDDALFDVTTHVDVANIAPDDRLDRPTGDTHPRR
jgi:hypothetical protein